MSFSLQTTRRGPTARYPDYPMSGAATFRAERLPKSTCEQHETKQFHGSWITYDTPHRRIILITNLDKVATESGQVPTRFPAYDIRIAQPNAQRLSGRRARCRRSG